MTDFAHPKPFLLSIHDVIHVEVKKVFSGATPPDFTYEDPAEDQLVMIYHSKRKMYDFVEGIIQGAAKHFGVPITCERTIVDPDQGVCRFHLTFGKCSSNQE
jgi:hypothetical protein